MPNPDDGAMIEESEPTTPSELKDKVTGGAENRVLYESSTNKVTNAAGLTFTNNVLGVGSTAPLKIGGSTAQILSDNSSKDIFIRVNGDREIAFGWQYVDDWVKIRRSGAHVTIDSVASVTALKINANATPGDYISCLTSVAAKVFHVSSANNVLIGNLAAAGTSAAGVLAIENGTQGAALANAIQLVSEDLSAGNTLLSIRTEGGGCYAAGTPAASTGSIAIKVDGTVYHFTVSTTAAA